MENLSKRNDAKRYCKKCLSLLDENVIRDYEGREFCSRFCRKEYYVEIRKESNCRFEEWIGL